MVLKAEGMTLSIGKKRHLNDERGFTFIELIIVVVIIGIITAITTPMFRKTFAGIQLDNLARNIVSSARFCQERAIVERLRYRLNLDPEEGRYWILKEKDPSYGEGFERIEGRLGRVHYIPRGSSIRSEEDYITFYPDGRADQVSIYLSDKTGRIYTLTTERRVGHVKVVEGRQE